LRGSQLRFDFAIGGRPRIHLRQFFWLPPAMDSGQSDQASHEASTFLKRSWIRNGVYAFAIMAAIVFAADAFPPARALSSYFQLLGYLLGGTAAGYYFSQDLDRRKIGFQPRDGIILWFVCAIALIAGIFAGGMLARAIGGGRLSSAFGSIARSVLGSGSWMTTAGSVVLALFGIALGHDIYLQQFTMLRPLSREKAAEVRQVASSLQPLTEAMHRFGRAFTVEQLQSILPEQARSSYVGAPGTTGDRQLMGEVLISLRDQGLLTLKDGMINITPKGENLLSISRYVGGLRERGEEGAELCAYCGRPLKLSDKLMRLTYYGKPYTMHYSERDGLSIFGRLPYIDKMLGLRPAEVARPVYLKPKVLPTVDHKAALALGLVGGGLALASYVLIVLNAKHLPIPTEVSFFSGTLLSVSLIFALCGIIGGLLTYLDPGGSYGGTMMLALLLFALPFIGLTRQIVFAGYYASVGLIAIGGAISLRAHTVMA